MRFLTLCEWGDITVRGCEKVPVAGWGGFCYDMYIFPGARTTIIADAESKKIFACVICVICWAAPA